MNKKQDCTFWLSVAAMIISVIAVCVTLIRCEPFDIDGISVLIGIMALVVTIYMSIQIVNALTEGKIVTHLFCRLPIAKKSHNRHSRIAP